MVDTFLVKQLRTHLRTQVLGKVIYHLPEIDSTNNFALQRAKEGCPEGTLVIADCQTRGRGQGDRQWYSPKGGLYLSIILRPVSVCPMNINELNVMAGSSVIRTIRDYGQIKADLKHPNDVLINGRKVAGILTEMQSGFKYITYLVMGIGVNLNIKEDEIPDELRAQVAIFREEGPPESVRIEFLQRLLEHIEKAYLCFCQTNNQDI